MPDVDVPDEVVESENFRDWLDSIRDRNTRLRIAKHVRRFHQGNFGDVEPVGSGVSETKIDVGPGWRVYHYRHGGTVYVLRGGEKKMQQQDIADAIADADALKRKLRDEES